MSSVDVTAIEEAMKMASLDQLRGYAQNHYGEVQQTRTPENITKEQALGYQVLREPMWNKGERIERTTEEGRREEDGRKGDNEWQC